MSGAIETVSGRECNKGAPPARSLPLVRRFRSLSPLVALPATSGLVAVFINPVIGLRDDLEPQFPTTRAPDKPGSQPHLGRTSVKWATLASAYLDIFDWVVDRRNRPVEELAEIHGPDYPPTQVRMLDYASRFDRH